MAGELFLLALTVLLEAVGFSDTLTSRWSVPLAPRSVIVEVEGGSIEPGSVAEELVGGAWL